MNSVFLEVLIDSNELESLDIVDRFSIEDVLEEKLDESGIAEVSGGGAGLGIINIDVDIPDENDLNNVLGIIRATLTEHKLPQSTKIRRHKPTKIDYPLYAE